MRRILLFTVAVVLCTACTPRPPVATPWPPPLHDDGTCQGPASGTPGPAITDPSSPNYDPDWESHYPAVWC